MLAIPTYVIAFFITVMAVPEGTHPFTMDVKGKTIQWTQEGTGWRAVELPRDDWGLHTIKGSQITITGEGHTLKTNMSRFLAIPEGFDWATAKTVPVAFKELGDPVNIEREEGKIVLSQTNGSLFRKPVTITWSGAAKESDSVVGIGNLNKAVTLATAYLKSRPPHAESTSAKYQVIAARHMPGQASSLWQITLKPTNRLPAETDNNKPKPNEGIVITVDLNTKKCSMAR